MPGRYRVSIAFLLLGLAAASIEAQNVLPSYRARLLGVFDEATGEPIEGVRVLDLVSGSFVQTSSTGTVSLLFLPEGASLVRLTKIGYQPRTMTVAVSPSDTTPITLIMGRVTELPKVVTTEVAPHHSSPALSGFEERRKIENGYFITEAELRKNDGRLLANLLKSKAPVRIRAGSVDGSYLMASARCANGGPPQVYLDGVPLAAAGPPSTTRTRNASSGAAPADLVLAPFNLNEFQISDLAAVEYYPDNDVSPIQFEHTSRRCGALLLWTRER